jgi:impB/mucB/samB family
MKPLQLRLNTLSHEQASACWAFAVDTKKARYKKYRTMQACIITACSREAKSLGVQAGMLYEEAKLLIPELKVMVCNW